MRAENTQLKYACVIGLGLLLGACGAAGGDDLSGTPGTGAIPGTGGSENGGASSGGSATGGGVAVDGGANDSGSLDPDAACAAEVFEAEPAPLNLMVMLDRSCSMSEPSADPLWDKAAAGMKTFFADPALDGIGVALHYFPAPGTDMVNYCMGDQATPTVAMGKLKKDAAASDAQEQALVQSIDEQTLNFGGTPMFQALYGALGYASVFATQHPDEQIVVVLVTDGVPGESCDYNVNNNIPKIAALAKFGFENTPSIRTFSIGLAGSNEQQIATIAQAGGGQAFFLGGSSNVTQDLFNKLDAIKQNNLGCTFQLPDADPGKNEDPTKVNVKLIDTGGETQFVKVSGKAACVPDGWYYDDEASPSKISLCPATCEQTKQDPNAKVQVLLGCATAIPK
jgi:hypothetical protein